MTMLTFTPSELSLNRSAFIKVLNEKKIPSFILAGQPHHEARQEFFRLALKAWDRHQTINEAKKNIKIQPSNNPSIIQKTTTPDDIYQSKYSPTPIIHQTIHINHSEIKQFLSQNVNPPIVPILKTSVEARQRDDIAQHFNNIRSLFFTDLTLIERFFHNDFNSDNQFLLSFINPNPYFHHHLSLFDSTLVTTQGLITYYCGIVDFLSYEFSNIFQMYQIDESINIVLKHFFFKTFVANLHIRHLKHCHHNFFEENPNSVNKRVPKFLFLQIKNHLNFLTGLTYEPFRISTKNSNGHNNLFDILKAITDSYNQFNNFKIFNYENLMFLLNNTHNFQENSLKNTSNLSFVIDDTSSSISETTNNNELPVFEIPSVESINEQQFKFFH